MSHCKCVGKRESLSLNVIETLGDWMLAHGVPEHVRSDNGAEMTAYVSIRPSAGGVQALTMNSPTPGPDSGPRRLPDPHGQAKGETEARPSAGTVRSCSFPVRDGAQLGGTRSRARPADLKINRPPTDRADRLALEPSPNLRNTL